MTPLRVGAEPDAHVDRPRWQHNARCRTSAIDFFATAPDAIAAAKAVCADCPVRADCLAYAIANEACGIWGGTSASERRRLRPRTTPRRRGGSGAVRNTRPTTDRVTSNSQE